MRNQEKWCLIHCHISAQKLLFIALNNALNHRHLVVFDPLWAFSNIWVCTTAIKVSIPSVISDEQTPNNSYQTIALLDCFPSGTHCFINTRKSEIRNLIWTTVTNGPIELKFWQIAFADWDLRNIIWIWY